MFFHPNPQPNDFAPVAQNYMFCSLTLRRRDAVVSLPKDQATKQWEEISIGAAERRGRHQRSDDTALCHLLWPLALCFVTLGGSVSSFAIFCFHICALGSS